jgi:molybdopterin-guanine dinucleotide biosynthesis protein A
MTRKISAVILAGGDNKRFNGITKANIVIGGKTIICRVMETIKDIFDEIIIVTNSPEKFAEYSDYKIIPDLVMGAGPLGGIHSALKASSNELLFIIAGDMPFINKRYIIRQIDYYQNNNCDILIPQINKYIEPLHSIYNISILGTLEKYLAGENDYSVREFIKKCNVGWFKLEDSAETRTAFMNINSPADLLFAEKIPGIE